LPWATYLGTTVADSCDTTTVNRAFFSATRWMPVTCARTSTAYLAFDGDYRQQLALLDTTLATAGWKVEDSPPLPLGKQPGLLTNLDYMHELPSDATAEQIARVAAEPTDVTAHYTVPIPSAFVRPDVGASMLGPNGTVNVVEAPRLPTVDDRTATHDRTLEYPSVKTTYFVDWQPYTRAQLAAAAYPAHGAVLAISLSAPYNTGK